MFFSVAYRWNKGKKLKYRTEPKESNKKGNYNRTTTTMLAKVYQLKLHNLLLQKEQWIKWIANSPNFQLEP